MGLLWVEVFSRQGYHLTQWIQGRNLGITCVVVSLVSGKVYKNIKLYTSVKVCKKTECMPVVLIPVHTIAKCGGRVGTE